MIEIKKIKKIFHLSVAWNAAAASVALTLYVSLRFPLSMHCSASAEADRCSTVFLWNMLSDSLPTPTTLLCSSCFGLRKRESLHRNNVLEMMEAEAKDGETIWEETKCVNERRWFTSSAQTNCYNSSAWLTELETDKSQDLAFGYGCGWSAEKANENFPTVFVSLVLILPLTLFYFFTAVTFCLFLSDVSLVPPQRSLVSQLVIRHLWMRKDLSLFLVFTAEGLSCAAVSERQLLLLRSVAEINSTHRWGRGRSPCVCQWWKVTEDVYVNATVYF